MARIQWTPIVAPDIGEQSLRAQSMAGSSLQSAFSTFGNLLNQWEGDRREENLAEIYRRQNAFAGTNDVAGYAADLADGDLTRGMSYLKASDIAGLRGFTNELRTGRNAEFSFNRQQIEAERSDKTYERTEADRIRRDNIVRTLAPFRQLVAEGKMTRAQFQAEAQKTMPGANAADIEAMFSMENAGVQTFRGDVNWDRDGIRWADSRQDRQWAIEDRDIEQDAQALALQFKEYGPNVTQEDLIGSAAYQQSSPRVRARALALAGLQSGMGSFAGGTAASGGDGSFSGEIPTSSTEDFVNKTFGAESGGTADPNMARPRNPDGSLASSALGAGQFIESTWLDTVKRHASDWWNARGGNREQILALRSNPAFMRRMTIAHTQDNEQVLRRSNVPINDATRYAAHFLGAQTAANLYNADRNAPIRSVVNAASINSNQAVFNPRRGPAITTVGQLQDVMAAKMGGRSPAQVRAEGQTLLVGASVAAGSDRYGPLARNVIPLMNDDRDNLTVAKEMTGEGGKFAGLNTRDVEQRIRAVQDMYRQQNGGNGRLSAAAAAQILANNVDPYSLGDFVGGFFGRRGSIGRGILPDRSISINGIREDLSQLRPQPVRDANGKEVVVNGQVQTEIPLATHYRNQQNREQIIATSETAAAQLAQARARLQQQEAADATTGIVNNPATLNLRRQVMQLEQQWRAFTGDAVGQLASAGQFTAPAAPPRPVARGTAGNARPVRPRPQTFNYMD